MSGIGPISETPRLNLFVGPVDPRSPAGVAAVATANRAYIHAFQVHVPVTVSTACFHVQVQSGNLEIGILDATGTVVATTGSFACPVAAISSSQPLAASVTLFPGRKYFAYVIADNTTVALAFLNSGFTNDPATLPLTYSVAQAIPAGASIALGATGFSRTHIIWFT